MTRTAIVWLRQDLRLADHPALIAAAAAGAVIPVYVLDDETRGPRFHIGAAQRWWLHGSLEKLARSFAAAGSRLVLRRGRADTALAQLADETDATHIHALRHAEPWWRKSEAALGERLILHDGNNLVPLRDVVTGSGQPYRVYSAFWRALQTHLPPPSPIGAHSELASPARWPHSETLDSWKLRPDGPNWAAGFDMHPGEAEAARRLVDFAEGVADYEVQRNLPGEEGTSRLSPHLHFGELSPAMVWHAVDGHASSEKFRKELAWRDFAQGVTLALPDYAQANGNRKYDSLKWRTGTQAEADLLAWKRGRTGYPIVDAGMRHLHPD